MLVLTTNKKQLELGFMKNLAPCCKNKSVKRFKYTKKKRVVKDNNYKQLNFFDDFLKGVC